MKVGKFNAEHYTWGTSNDGWRLADGPSLSVIHEAMPPGASEERHFHRTARQFFFVLEGRAEIEVDGVTSVLERHEGIEVAPGMGHRIFSRSGTDVEFIVCSQPSTKDDRQAAGS